MLTSPQFTKNKSLDDNVNYMEEKNPIYLVKAVKLYKPSVPHVCGVCMIFSKGHRDKL